MKKLFSFLFSLFRKRPFHFQVERRWTKLQAEDWLEKHGFKRFQRNPSIWIFRNRKDGTTVSFFLCTGKDYSFSSAVMVAKAMGRTYWCSKEQKTGFKNPLLALKDSLSFLNIQISDGGEEIFHSIPMVRDFASDRKRWKNSNTSSKFLLWNRRSTRA